MKHSQLQTAWKSNRKKSPPAIAACWLLTICTCLLMLQASAVVRRVDASRPSNGNGSTWATAYKFLQDAINASASGDEIWIKAGTYYPVNTGTGSFAMKSGVKIYGGFDGGETVLGQQDWIANKVILTNNPNYTIITNNNVSSSALLDGVTIAEGYVAAQNFFNTGGMDNSGSSFPTLNNIIFSGCFGNYGGALTIGGGNSSITNVTFENNFAKNEGGAVFISNASPKFDKVVFRNNTAGDGSSTTAIGGAVVSYNSSPSFTNVVFENNSSYGGGSAVYNTNTAATLSTARASFLNVLFTGNRSTTNGAAVHNISSQPYLINCTFANNWVKTSGSVGGVYNGSGGATTTITNCVFYGNGYAPNSSLVTRGDISNTPGNTNAITYSSFQEAGNFPGSNNIPSFTTSPFKDISNPDGGDGAYFTADDGLRLNVCTAGNAIDKGNNSANTATTDLSGLARKFDVPLVADGGLGSSPFIDMGAYEDQTTTTLLSITGSIGNAHTVPYPKELATDNITNVQSPTVGGAITYSWQQSTDGTTWTTIAGATSATYNIPSISQTTDYRRGVATTQFCNTPFYSNVVQITVVQPNGVIEGQVTSSSGAPVQGITITATRQQAVSGGPANYSYPSVVTGADGRYTINNVYYGTTTAGATVRITPSKAGHTFNFAFLDRTLTPNTPNPADANFIDNTVTSITGLTFQQCTDCLLTSGSVGTQNCPIDSILIYKGPNSSSLTYATTSGYINPDYGRYALTVSDPTTILIEPRLTGHTFNPVNRSVTPTDNLSGIDFQDVTSRTITGKISAGCNNFIGTAVLEFTDVLPNASNGSVRPSCFRKRVTTTSTGNYSITLPARKYKVRVISFTPAAGSNVIATDVVDFINTKIPTDSLTRDISTQNAVLNVVYQRPPVIIISGGFNLLCPTTPPSFAVIRQGALDSFNVFAYQGPATLNCPISDTSTKIRILTNVQTEDQLQERFFQVSGAGTKVVLKGGTPNITGDFKKDLFVYFTDKYGRVATNFNRKVLVTGVKADTATFTTVSPEIPMVVLHDPPGDASYSKWAKTNSITNALRFYTASSNSVEGWAEAKIGAKLIVGLGVATEISAWGTIGGGIEVVSSNTSSNETILTTSTTEDFYTSDNPGVIGSSGDVYVGAALNLIYAKATEIGLTGSGCTIAPTTKKKLIVANNGFATKYIYTEDFILNTLIPNLQSIASLSTPDSAARYLNQIKVWQQVVDNNTENKRRAAFVENVSFSGGLAAEKSTTVSSTKNSTIEFTAEMNAALAVELGFEASGSGLSGGVNVEWKMETGNSVSNEVTEETTMFYKIADNDGGDFFSVNVKTDPVYSTPVFELVAATASCPSEPGAQARDDVFFTAVNPVVQNVPAGDFANFNLKIVNTSPSNETRSYRLWYDPSSSVANEEIRIAGSPATGQSFITIGPLAYLDSVTVLVSVRRQPGSSVYTYEGMRFRVTDGCASADSRLAKTVQVSAYFISPCSNITLTQPAEGWQLTSAGGNQIFIKPAGYDLTTLSSVNVQYATSSGTNWADGPFLTTAQLASGFNFDASALPEGPISIRLRLDCNSGTSYSPRSTGFIDRKAPQLFGRPSPTDDSYVNGDVISFTYDESLNTNGANVQATVRRLSNNTLIPATVSIFENRIIITPTNSIAGLNGDSIRVIVSGISDPYGNVRTKADTTRFVVGTTVPGTGNQALTVSITNPIVYKNGDSTINVFFNLPVNAANDVRVNFTASGTARFGIDYTVTYSNAGALYAGFNGATGSIGIASGSKQGVLRIKPINGDTSLSPDKTVIISLTEGGDYSLGATTSATGNITSEDGITVYTFIGDGNWNIKNNWLNGKMPLTTLVGPKEIIINPSGTCVLNVAQTIKPGAKITVKQNRRMVIQGSLKMQ